jgi:hypothetical protein
MVRLLGAILIFSSCVLDTSNKHACVVDSDCNVGRICRAQLCVDTTSADMLAADMNAADMLSMDDLTEPGDLNGQTDLLRPADLLFSDAPPTVDLATGGDL